MASNKLNTGALFINEGVATFNVATLSLPGQLGMFYEKDGKKYQLVLLTAGAVAGAAGQAVWWHDFDDFVVNNDISDLTTARNQPAGVVLGTVTAGNYCFIQVRGPYATVKTNADDDIAAGDTLIIAATTDGTVDSVAAGTASTYVPFGIATAADVDADDTVAAILTMPLNGA